MYRTNGKDAGCRDGPASLSRAGGDAQVRRQPAAARAIQPELGTSTETAASAGPEVCSTTSRTERNGLDPFDRPDSKAQDDVSSVPAAFKPRKSGGKSKGGRKRDEASPKSSSAREGTTASSYRDRAAERRHGQAGDYAEAEKLLEVSRWRRFLATADTCTPDVPLARRCLRRRSPEGCARKADGVSRAPTSILDSRMTPSAGRLQGGDAEHSILVKGLDMALLKRRRAEIANGGTAGAEVTDDDLEAALRAGPDDPDVDMTDPLPAAKPKKRTRDDMVAELKAKSGASAASDAPGSARPRMAVDELKASGKFKPINVRQKTEEEQAEEERRERKRRRKEEKRAKAEKEAREADLAKAKAAAVSTENARRPEAEPVAPTVAALMPAASLPEAPELGLAMQAIVEAAVETEVEPAPSSLVEASAPPPAAEPSAPWLADESDDDVDIFAGAGDYKGLGGTSDEDEDEDEEPGEVDGGKTALQATTLRSGRKTWFDDDDDPEPETEPGHQAPKEASGPSTAEDDRPSTSAAESGRQQSPPRSASGSPPAEPIAAAQRKRLEGLSGSSDISTLLAMDSAAERAEKKAARKLKGKAAKEARKGEMTDAQRLNRDWQQLVNYEKRKQGQ